MPYLSLLSNSSQENPLGGITLLVFALFLFSLQDVVIKYFSDQYSVLQIVFVRGIIAGLLMALVAELSGGLRQLAARKPWLIILRGLFGFCSYTTFYLAVASLPLAEVVAIVFTAPLFVTVMSALFLREQVGIRRWSAVTIGFIGVLIMLGPSMHFDGIGVILSFCAALTYALQTILTRRLSLYDNPLSIAFNATLVFTCASGLLSLLVLSGIFSMTSSHPSFAFLMRDWMVPDTIGMLLMIFLGFNGALAFFGMSKAYCVAPASSIAPFEYTYLIWAVVFGYLLWGEVPRTTTLIGVLILISSSLYIWFREHRLQRSLRPVAVVENQTLAHT